MVNITDSLIQESYGIKQQLGNLPDTTQSLRRFQDDIIVKDVVAKVESYSIGSSFVIGHPTLAQRDVTLLETVYGEAELIYVIPNNDIFVEYFSQDLFMADSSTGTLNTDETYSLDTNEALFSEIIYKTNSIPVSVELLEPFTDDYSPVGAFRLDNSGLSPLPNSTGYDGLWGGSGLLMVSGDNGGTWVTYYTQSGLKNFDNATTDGIIYKLYSFEGLEVTSPIKFKINT